MASPTIKASSVRNPFLIRDTDLVLFGIMSSRKIKRTGLDKSWINSYDRCDFTLNYPVCKMFGEGQGFCSTAMGLRNHEIAHKSLSWRLIYKFMLLFGA